MLDIFARARCNCVRYVSKEHQYADTDPTRWRRDRLWTFPCATHSDGTFDCGIVSLMCSDDLTVLVAQHALVLVMAELELMLLWLSLDRSVASKLLSTVFSES